MPVTDPVVPLFAAGFGPQPSDFNTLIQTPFEFLTTKVMLRAELQATQSLTANTNNFIHFGSTAGDILEDPYGGWSTTATASQPQWSWLCPTGCSGVYDITMTGFNVTPTGRETIEILLSGTTFLIMNISQVAGQNSGCCGSYPYIMTGGVDYIQGVIDPSATVNTTATAGQYPTLEICWMSL